MLQLSELHFSCLPSLLSPLFSSLLLFQLSLSRSFSSLPWFLPPLPFSNSLESTNLLSLISPRAILTKKNLDQAKENRHLSVMAPSYKNQIVALREALTQSNAELQVAKADAAKSRTSASTIYRGISASWRNLKRIDCLREYLTSEATFLDEATLRGQNLEVMTDHMLVGLEQIVTACAQIGLTIERIRPELEASEEIVQTHRDASDIVCEIDLASPLGHLNRAFEWIEAEDQKIRAQVQASQELRYDSYKRLEEALASPTERRFEDEGQAPILPGKAGVVKAIRFDQTASVDYDSDEGDSTLVEQGDLTAHSDRSDNRKLMPKPPSDIQANKEKSGAKPITGTRKDQKQRNAVIKHHSKK